jgi:hypothetical protein
MLCTLWTLGVIFFLLGSVALIAAWTLGSGTATWLGMDSDFLLGNAAVLFVLSLTFKMKKHWLKRSLKGSGCGGDCGRGCGGACGSGGCGPEGCGAGGCGTGTCCS